MKINLNNDWTLAWRDLNVTAERAPEVMIAEDFIPAGNLPCDAHMPLILKEIIKDPVVADYSYACEWMERKSWWFKKEFDITDEQLTAKNIQLVLESLDLYADIFLNGNFIGNHESCHFPFVKNILDYAIAGKNTLLVRLTAGPERINKGQLDYLADYICTESDVDRGDRGEKARAFLRKPQYVYGWDWGPRIATIGIMKNAYLNVNNDFAVTQVHPVTLEATSNAKMRFEVQFESYRPISTFEATVQLNVTFEGKPVLSMEQDVLAVSGVNFVDFDAIIEDAQLWWPAGAGQQPLYTVDVTLKSNTCEYKSEPIRTGIRTVGLNLEKYGDNDRRFAVVVNGVSIYCKGGDWIPSDSVYARVTPEKYESLVRNARDCNFNMLRVWGGGIYECDEFYNLCDEYGILLWHDFMFGCAMYPDDQEWFRQLVCKEIDYQTNRLRHHPCIALWCGNNENQWLFEQYLGSGKKHLTSGGLVIYNEIIPTYIRKNCPEIPYWRSSPYGGEMPNDNEVGDRHHWRDCTMSDEMENRINPEAYDAVTSRFVSEYGYIGPCSEETIQKYYGDNPINRGDKIWNLHNNTFEKATVPEGIRKHYIDPENLEMKDYLQYARLVQGLMYSYSLEAIRFYPRNDGAIFWMYNDTWGEVGWTIIDYYLDRKPSFYYVKRAFAHIKLILRASEDKKTVKVMGVNDTPKDITQELEYGYVGFDGKYDTKKVSVELKAFSKGIVLEFAMPEHDVTSGVIFARTQDAPLAILRTGSFRSFKKADSSVTIEKIEAVGNDYKVTLKSTGYSHAVSLGLKASVEMDDAFFDMLPNDTRTITVYDGVTKGVKDLINPVFLSAGK